MGVFQAVWRNRTTNLTITDPASRRLCHISCFCRRVRSRFSKTFSLYRLILTFLHGYPLGHIGQSQRACGTVLVIRAVHFHLSIVPVWVDMLEAASAFFFFTLPSLLAPFVHSCSIHCSPTCCFSYLWDKEGRHHVPVISMKRVAGKCITGIS